MIAAWQALEKGAEPGPDYIRNRMRDYVRKLHRESRQPAEENIEYQDDRDHEPSPYGPREKASRARVDMDDLE